MSRSCPICDRQPLQVARVGEAQIELCARCQGLWFDAGELELFPDRPSVSAFLSAARLAPGRCRRQGHRVPRGMGRCATCGADPARCPNCGAVLSMVAAPTCVIDVCTGCRGVWLDKGELELLAGVTGPPALPAAPAKQQWDIPQAAAPAEAADPWKAPGSTRGLCENSSHFVRSALVCNGCGAGISAFGAWAFDSETYCAACKPEGAIGGKDLPSDRRWGQGGMGNPLGSGRLGGLRVLEALLEAVRWLVR